MSLILFTLGECVHLLASGVLGLNDGPVRRDLSEDDHEVADEEVEDDEAEDDDEEGDVFVEGRAALPDDVGDL